MAIDWEGLIESLREHQETLDECVTEMKGQWNSKHWSYPEWLLHNAEQPNIMLENVRGGQLSPDALPIAIGLCQAEIAKILITLLTDLDTRKAEPPENARR